MANKNLMRWDPLRIMRRWDPFTEMREMQYELDRLFEGLGKDVAATGTEGFGAWMPSVESYLKDNELIVKCELPGIDPKEVDVTVDENAHQLLIKGERKIEKDTKEEAYIHRELTYGTFERRFTLPEGVKADQVKAKFTNGILEISVPSPAVRQGKKDRDSDAEP